MTEKEKPKEMFELNANGSFVTPQMGRVVRESAPLAHEVRVHPMQMKKIVDLYLDVTENPKSPAGVDLSLTRAGHIFSGLHLNQDQYMPDSEMRFYDAKGNLVAKIVGLER